MEPRFKYIGYDYIKPGDWYMIKEEETACFYQSQECFSGKKFHIYRLVDGPDDDCEAKPLHFIGLFLGKPLDWWTDIKRILDAYDLKTPDALRDILHIAIMPWHTWHIDGVIRERVAGAKFDEWNW